MDVLNDGLVTTYGGNQQFLKQTMNRSCQKQDTKAKNVENSDYTFRSEKSTICRKNTTRLTREDLFIVHDVNGSNLVGYNAVRHGFFRIAGNSKRVMLYCKRNERNKNK